MGTLAARLNVRVAVLYTYVSGRAELVRLAAQRAAGNAAYPEDRGQSWQDFAMRYAEANHRVVLNGQMVSVMLDGDLSPAAKVDSSEHWVEVMLGYGFTAQEALTLLGTINIIVLGGAVVNGYVGAISKDEAEYRDLVRASVTCRPAEDLPHLANHVEAYVESSVSIWRPALDLLFKSIEDQRKRDEPNNRI